MKQKEKENGLSSGYWNEGKYSHINLLRELQSNEPGDFKNYLRMENHLFYELLSLVKPFIEKQYYNAREYFCGGAFGGDIAIFGYWEEL